MKFWKMSGSGNDFVFVDGIGHPQDAAVAADPDFVRTVCAPHTGVGADGVAIFRPSEDADFALSYFNRDGSEGELCGNASLCAVRLSTEPTEVHTPVKVSPTIPNFSLPEDIESEVDAILNESPNKVGRVLFGADTSFQFTPSGISHRLADYEDDDDLDLSALDSR